MSTKHLHDFCLPCNSGSFVQFQVATILIIAPFFYKPAALHGADVIGTQKVHRGQEKTPIAFPKFERLLIKWDGSPQPSATWKGYVKPTASLHFKYLLHRVIFDQSLKPRKVVC